MKTLFFKRIQGHGKNYPGSREGHTLSYNPNQRKWLLFGGFGLQRSNDVHQFDSLTYQWTQLEIKGKAPPKRNYHIAWVDNEQNVLYIYGGQSERREPLGDLYALHLEFLNWTKFYTTERPQGRMNSAGKSYKGSFYLFGGLTAPNNTYLNDLWSIPFSNVNWNRSLQEVNNVTWVNHKLKGDIPTKRHGHTINLIENKLILFGGITEEGYSDEIFLIDLITFQCQKQKQWGNVPSPRAFHTSEVYLNNTLFLFGGITMYQTTASHSLKALNDIFLLQIDTMYWTVPFVAGHWPKPRYNHAMAFGINTQSMEQLLIVGGIDQTYVGMDVFCLEEHEVSSGQQWRVEDLMGYRHKTNAIAENSLMANKKKIREMERDMYIARDDMLALERETDQLQLMLEKEKKESEEEYNVLVNRSNIRFKENRLNAIYNSYYSETNQTLDSKLKLKQERNIRLENVIKKAESLLIDLDALYTEIIESNVTPEFRGLVKDKVEEIDERKKKHYESLVEFRSKYEKTVDAIDTVNQNIKQTKKQLKEAQELVIPIQDLDHFLDEVSEISAFD